ncbi:MAG: beta-galactosidase, partial [Sphingopyxis sp.]|nr:beta-galactosidase [Sphingopyxis sp.]
VPPGDCCRTLRFGSADYFAEVWIDGTFAGASGAAMLPFEIALQGLPVAGAMVRIVVRVTNELPIDGPTQRVTRGDYLAEGRKRDEYLPAVRFDFFPYGGINRPVHLVLTPRTAIADYRVVTRIDGTDGLVDVDVMLACGAAGRVRVTVAGLHAEGIAGTLTLRIADCHFWSPDAPALYDLTIELLDDRGTTIDCVAQKIGIREIRVAGSQLLLNGTPIVLKGFGKHEDSPIRGRGLDLPLLVKDFALLRWTGANSVRTSHYPYAEEFYDFADRHGIMVIDEIFSVNLDFRRVNDATLAAHQAAASELIARDRNRTCVIAWSLANEPGYLGEAEYRMRSPPYWQALFDHARALDPTRPLTHANVGYAGIDDPAFAHADIVTINRYHGWYSEPGQIDRAAASLRDDFAVLAVHGKPVFVAEFGADALAGQHATYDQMFTEEYQADFIAAYWREIVAHPAVIGGHVWNFADFRTAQHGRRVILNLKGVFTRGREPKRAAWLLRDLWGGR